MNIESPNHRIEEAVAVESMPSPTLLERMSALVRQERTAAAMVIAHLVEIERRRLHLDEACSSLFRYCMDRLGYSEGRSRAACSCDAPGWAISPGAGSCGAGRSI